MTQLPERFGFDLADAFARYCERPAHFFEGVLGAVFEAKAHLDYLFFVRCQLYGARAGRSSHLTG